MTSEWNEGLVRLIGAWPVIVAAMIVSSKNRIRAVREKIDATAATSCPTFYLHFSVDKLTAG